MSMDNSTDDQTETQGGRHNVRRFMPWYNDKADYNTNAPSYYDFLARPNYYWKLIGEIINRLLRRDIIVKETKSITLNKLTDWQDEGVDDITLSADLHVSKHVGHDNDMNIDMPNALQLLDDGVYVGDYLPAVKKNHADIVALDKRLTTAELSIIQLQKDVTKLKSDVATIMTEIQTINENIKTLTATVATNQTMLYKIVDNLIKSGAWGGDRATGNIVTGRDIASGNINLYSGNESNNNAILTHPTVKDNDLKAGR